MASVTVTLMKHWGDAEIRGIYDFEKAKFTGNDFTTAIVIRGIYRWGYSRGPSMATVRESTDTDIYCNDQFLTNSYSSPQHLVDWDTPPRAFWLYERNVYAADGHDLTVDDVRALINVTTNKRRLLLEKAHALQAMTAQLDDRSRRERIPQQVKVAVWQRDLGRCVECGDQKNLEFDHVIPIAMGGSNRERNLQLLCATCNRSKGATLG